MANSSETQLVTRMCEYWYNLPGQQSSPPKMSGPTFNDPPKFFSDISKTPGNIWVDSASDEKVLLQYKGMMKIADLAEFLITRTFQDPDIDLPGFYNTKTAASLADDLSSFVVMTDRQGRSGLDRLLSEKIPSGSSIDEVILLYENKSPNRHIVAAQVLENKASHLSTLIRACDHLTSKYNQQIHDKLFPIEAKKRKEQKEEEVNIPAAIGSVVFWLAVGIGIWYYWPQVKSGASSAINYAKSYVTSAPQTPSQPGTNPEQPNSVTQPQVPVIIQPENQGASLVQRAGSFWDIMYQAASITAPKNSPVEIAKQTLGRRRQVLRTLDDYLKNEFYANPAVVKALATNLFGYLPLNWSSIDTAFDSYMRELDVYQLLQGGKPSVVFKGSFAQLRDYMKQKLISQNAEPSRIPENLRVDYALLDALAGMQFGSSSVNELAIVKVPFEARGRDDAKSFMFLSIGGKWYILQLTDVYKGFRKNVMGIDDKTPEQKKVQASLDRFYSALHNVRSNFIESGNIIERKAGLMDIRTGFYSTVKFSQNFGPYPEVVFFDRVDYLVEKDHQIREAQIIIADNKPKFIDALAKYFFDSDQRIYYANGLGTRDDRLRGRDRTYTQEEARQLFSDSVASLENADKYALAEVRVDRDLGSVILGLTLHYVMVHSNDQWKLVVPR